MREKPTEDAERCRMLNGPLASNRSFGNNGAFIVTYKAKMLRVIISDEDGWDHVSVSLRDRTPTWEEMCYIKDMFFSEDEWVIQYHPAKKDNINYHPHCLHLWKKQGYDLPLPPKEMIA